MKQFLVQGWIVQKPVSHQRILEHRCLRAVALAGPEADTP